MIKKIKTLISKSFFYIYLLNILQKIRLHFVDTYIVSYPKSGRTWVRFFLSVYLSRRYALPLRLDWYYLLLPQSIKRFHFTHLDFKAADVHEIEKTIFELKGKNVLYLVRDPRDSIVSFYFYRKHRQAIEGFQDFTMSEYIRDKEYGIQQIIDYMNVVFKHKDLYKNFKVVRYEDLRDAEKGPAVFKEILEFIGQSDIDSDVFRVALEQSEFNNMQKLEKTNAIDDDRMRSKEGTDTNALNVRRGKVSGYKDYFSTEDITYTENEMKKLNEVFGY